MTNKVSPIRAHHCCPSYPSRHTQHSCTWGRGWLGLCCHGDQGVQLHQHVCDYVPLHIIIVACGCIALHHRSGSCIPLHHHNDIVAVVVHISCSRGNILGTHNMPQVLVKALCECFRLRPSTTTSSFLSTGTPRALSSLDRKPSSMITVVYERERCFNWFVARCSAKGRAPAC